MSYNAEAWRDWRRESEGLSWRVALPSDLPAIERMWEAKARIIGVKHELPDLFASPVVLTLVAEDARGRIVDGAFFEAVIDVTKLGAKPGGFRSLTRIASELAGFFRSRTFRRVTAAMPEKVSEKMGAGLAQAGFREQPLRLWERGL
jgi:hypothetical protein